MGIFGNRDEAVAPEVALPSTGAEVPAPMPAQEVAPETAVPPAPELPPIEPVAPTPEQNFVPPEQLVAEAPLPPAETANSGLPPIPPADNIAANAVPQAPGGADLPPIQGAPEVGQDYPELNRAELIAKAKRQLDDLQKTFNQLDAA